MKRSSSKNLAHLQDQTRTWCQYQKTPKKTSLQLYLTKTLKLNSCKFNCKFITKIQKSGIKSLLAKFSSVTFSPIKQNVRRSIRISSTKNCTQRYFRDHIVIQLKPFWSRFRARISSYFTCVMARARCSTVVINNCI